MVFLQAWHIHIKLQFIIENAEIYRCIVHTEIHMRCLIKSAIFSKNKSYYKHIFQPQFRFLNKLKNQLVNFPKVDI